MDEQIDKENADVQLVDKWLDLLGKEGKAHDKYRQQAEDAEKEFDNGSDFNIFWSNIQIMKGALFSSTPKPEVRRRNRETQGPAKQAATLIERALDFQVDSSDFVGTYERVVQDFCVAAMGIPRVRYKAEIREAIDKFTGESVEVISGQSTCIEYHPWKDFHWQPCKSWEKCDWIAFDYMKSKKDVRKEYGVVAEECDSEEGESRVKVTEILHRSSRSRIVICDQFKAPLDISEDELNLKDFFPIPKPLMANISGKLIPKPDYFYYKKKAKAINVLSKRLDSIEAAIKDVGIYAGELTELASLESRADGAMVPVEDFLGLTDGTGDLNKMIAKLPIQHTMVVAEALSRRLDERKEEIYEITGLSDIMRGATQASETAKAQDIKAQFGSVRLRSKQSAVAVCVRDIFRIMAEIIGEHFEPDILTKMTGIEATPDVMAILKDDLMRNFSIDVETESTIQRDEQQEIRQRLEGLKVASDYIQGLLPAMTQGQVPFELGKEMILLSIRGFKYGGNLEDMIAQLDQQNVIGGLQLQVQQMGQQMQELQGQLAKVNQVDAANTMADTAKKQAEAAKTGAEAEEQNIENMANIHNLSMGAPAVNMG